MNLEIRHGNALDLLRALPAGTVQTCVTSPPYWGLRTYGTEPQTWGGSPDCDHVWGEAERSERAAAARSCGGSASAGGEKRAFVRERGTFCACGAWRGELGLEPTPALYVEHVVAVFREVRRVLRDDGTLWLNLGDSYVASTTGALGDRMTIEGGRDNQAAGLSRPSKTGPGLKPKDLVGIPWRVAFALQADGWWLRADVVWAKPNPMPESVTDRPTKAHEYLFLLAKSDRYYYDAAAIKEPCVYGDHPRNGAPGEPVQAPGQPVQSGITKRRRSGNKARTYGDAVGRPAGEGPGRGVPWEDVDGQRNKRSVWTIQTEPFPEAHFAVMPQALAEPCVLAGSRGPGRKCDCHDLVETPTGTGGGDDPSLQVGRAGLNRPRAADEGTRPITRLEQRSYARQLRESPHRDDMAAEAGPAFAHYIRTDRSGARPIPPALLTEWLARGWLEIPEPCSCPVTDAGDLVLDPFAGSGTVGVVALRHGRRFVGFDLRPDYVAMARRRVAGPLFAGEASA